MQLHFGSCTYLKKTCCLHHFKVVAKKNYRLFFVHSRRKKNTMWLFDFDSHMYLLAIRFSFDTHVVLLKCLNFRATHFSFLPKRHLAASFISNRVADYVAKLSVCLFINIKNGKWKPCENCTESNWRQRYTFVFFKMLFLCEINL